MCSGAYSHTVDVIYTKFYGSIIISVGSCFIGLDRGRVSHFFSAFPFFFHVCATNNFKTCMVIIRKSMLVFCFQKIKSVGAVHLDGVVDHHLFFIVLHHHFPDYIIHCILDPGFFSININRHIIFKPCFTNRIHTIFETLKFFLFGSSQFLACIFLFQQCKTNKTGWFENREGNS